MTRSDATRQANDRAGEAASALATLSGVPTHQIAVVLGSGWVPAADLLGSTVAEFPSPTSHISPHPPSRATPEWCAASTPMAPRCLSS